MMTGLPTWFNGHSLWPSPTYVSGASDGAGSKKKKKKKNGMSICNVCLSIVSRERDIP